MQDFDCVYEDPDWEAYRFEDEELSISKSIVCRGQFGASYVLGKIHPNKSKTLPSNISTVAMMKSCVENDEGKCYNGLKSEINILYDLCHTNVTQLLGYCLEQHFNDACKLVLVYECCSNGNLIKVLHKGRPFYNCGAYCPTKAINNEILSPDVCLNFCAQDLLKWATEISRGMEYLAFKGVVHADIAARNILLNSDWTAKLGNFGISQRVNRQKSYAENLPKDVFPIAWMAPEAIKDFSISESSDVWSYGITLWEIYSLGDVPYKESKVEVDSNFVSHLEQHLRPTRPDCASDDLWKLMRSCWTFKPEERPTFSKIKNFLDRSLLLTKKGLLTASGTSTSNAPERERDAQILEKIYRQRSKRIKIIEPLALKK